MDNGLGWKKTRENYHAEYRGVGYHIQPMLDMPGWILTFCQTGNEHYEVIKDKSLRRLMQIAEIAAIRC